MKFQFSYVITLCNMLCIVKSKPPSTRESGEDASLKNDFMKLSNTSSGTKYLYQRDMKVGIIQKMRLQIKQISRTKRAALGHNNRYLWKNGRIYYKIQKTFDHDAKFHISKAIRYWKKATKHCLTFIKLKGSVQFEERESRNYFDGRPVPHILFVNGEDAECWSDVGRQETTDGKQVVYLGKGCAHFGTIMHEIGHAVGFYHEQQRQDRDKFVKVSIGNIIPDRRDQYSRTKFDGKVPNSMGYAYDYWSIMHYPENEHAKNGKSVTKVRRPYRHLKPRIGQRKSLSYIDIAQVRAMYRCNKIPSMESTKTCVKKSTKGRDYRGKLDYTEKGVMCQPWNRQYPHKHHLDLNNKLDDLKVNYCRNPGGEKDRPWCYTTYGKDKYEDWQYCDLSMC